MKSIQVVVATMPRLLHEIVLDTLASEPDMKIVGESAGLSELSLLVRGAGPDVVIAACDASEVASLSRAVSGRPPVLLAIVDEGKRGLLHELKPQLRDLGELSPGALIAAIRDASRGD